MFGNLGIGELAVILVIVLVLFGAKRVPEISASFGKGIREFKRNLNEVEGSVTSHFITPEDDPAGVPRRVPLRRTTTDDTPERAREAVEREPKRLL